MHVDEKLLAPVLKNYGRPQVFTLDWAISEAEMQMLQASKRGWRQHDVTLFIEGPTGRLALIRKPFYPEGAYRAPSGGIDRGEAFEAGALREAFEETGLQVRLQRYLARFDVTFTCGQVREPWVSHVLWATTEAETLAPQDTQEVDGAVWATSDACQTTIRERLYRAGRPLLRYRVWLTDVTLGLALAGRRVNPGGE